MEQLCLNVVLGSKFKLIMKLNSKELFLLLCSYLDSNKVPSMHACMQLDKVKILVVINIICTSYGPIQH